MYIVQWKMSCALKTRMQGGARSYQLVECTNCSRSPRRKDTNLSHSQSQGQDGDSMYVCRVLHPIKSVHAFICWYFLMDMCYVYMCMLYIGGYI